MEFKYHDLICWIIPGIFFMGMLMLADIVFDLEIFDFSMVRPDLSLTDKNAKWDQGAVVTMLIFCIPVFGMIVGYILNYFASLLEWYSYKGWWKIRLPRASEMILNKKSKRVEIGDAVNFDKFLSEVLPERPNKFINDSAERAIAKVKQTIDLEKLDTYYYKCIFGRNLAFAQLIIILIILSVGCVQEFSSFFSTKTTITLFLTDIFAGYALFCAWRRNQQTYIKNCIVEYIKSVYKNQ